MIQTKKRADILVEALPYIQKYYGKVVVIKYGGNAMLNADLKNSVMRDIVLLSTVGIKVVLVHGGGPDVTKMMDKLGKESVFIDGLRYTDNETAEISSMVLTGKVNQSLVTLIHSNHGRSIGFAGTDGNLIHARKMKNSVDLGMVGDIVKIDPSIIELSLENNYIPVVASTGVGEDGLVYNINADTAAAEIAAALSAEKLILMTDIRGVLQDPSDESSLITNIATKEIRKLIKEGVITGGMIPKVKACVDAMKKGLKSTVIIDGRVEHSILLELFSDSGIGSLIEKV